MSFFKGSPYRRHSNSNDVESGGGIRGDEDEESSSSDPFNITSTKNASIARLRKWRVRFFFSQLYFYFWPILYLKLELCTFSIALCY